jgi:hypothetical protein
MEKKLLNQSGFSQTFIDYIQQYPNYPLYEQSFLDVSSVQVVQQIKNDLIINNPGLDFNDLRLQHFRSTANSV